MYHLMMFYVFKFQVWVIYPSEIICGSMHATDKVQIWWLTLINNLIVQKHFCLCVVPLST